MAIHNREILEAIQAMDSKITDIKEEMLINRDSISYINEMKKTITVDDFRKKMETVDDLEDIKLKGVGAITVISFAWGIIFWFITKKLI